MITGAIGVKDRFGDSGAPWELIKEFEVSAEHIAQKAVELLAVAKMKKKKTIRTSSLKCRSYARRTLSSEPSTSLCLL